jgi:uncharacterized membrane protein
MVEEEGAPAASPSASIVEVTPHSQKPLPWKPAFATLRAQLSPPGGAFMAFCKACGQDAGDASFCPKCGAPQGASQGVAQSAAVAPPSADSATASIDENVAGLLSYLVGWITGLIFLLIDKRPFVKFHAAQSIAVNICIFPCWIALWIIELVLAHIPIIGFLGLIMFPIFGLVIFAVWIFLMYKAYSHEKFKLPIIGDIVEGMVNK